MATEPYRGHISMRVNARNGYFDFEYGPAGEAIEIDGPLEVSQAARLRLVLWRGGWVLDRSHGFPWHQFLGRKDVTSELLRMQMQAVILRDARIRRVNEITVEPDDKNRVWHVRWLGETATGEALLDEFSLGRE